MDELDSDAMREVERLQELHRRNVLDIRRFRNAVYLDPFMMAAQLETLLHKLEQRSTQAVVGQGKGVE